MFNFLTNLNEREIRKIRPIVQKVNNLADTVSKLSKEQIRERILELKTVVREQIRVLPDSQADNPDFANDQEKLENWLFERRKKAENDILSEIMPELFALVKEASGRTLKERHFDVQLIGGVVLHQGKIAEMKTGEGKTLVATLAACLNALAGEGVHIVTVNDYLSKRDAAWMGQIYNYLGLSVAAIGHESSLIYDPEGKRAYDAKEREKAEETGEVYTSDDSPLIPISRKEAYQADIVYGTNNEFGFDYLRDNMAQSSDQLVQRKLHYAIVDEVDSILIDEARTPLIISAPAAESTGQYRQFAEIVSHLKPDDHYAVDEKMKAVSLTDDGITTVEKLLGVENIYQAGGVILVHHLEEALKARVLFSRDKDYVVKDGEVIIVDEFTGRLMPGRRYSEGLHQAIEAKEGVEVKQESLTLATISFQNLFRIYDKLSGMTGTAATEAEEFHKIYGLDVVEIPTNRPNARTDYSDQIFKSQAGKFNAVVKSISERHAKGQPVLVGTVSIEKNELLSHLLTKTGIKHEVLNAKNHEREAHIIARAGQKGAVTVATNMAGRGTDIKPEKAALELGGLHVIGTERHESRRIDNQLRGRTGRQGDSGSSQFFVSMEDDLMRIFGGDRLKSLMTTLKLPEDQPIEHKMISRAIEGAQKKVEGHNFDIRKHLVEYDDVMNKHREVIYRRRRKILLTGNDQASGLKEEIISMISNRAKGFLDNATLADGNFEKARDEFSKSVGLDLRDVKPEFLTIVEAAKTRYEEKEAVFGHESMRDIEKTIFLRAIDTLWIDHLTNMDRLREGIGLRGYGQYDPLVAYKQEAWKMFNRLLEDISVMVTEMIFRVEMIPPVTISGETVKGAKEESSGQVIQELMKTNQKASGPTSAIEAKADKIHQIMETESRQSSINNIGKKIGRNDLCPCGSGKKYKKCHGK